jgi:hypothetical protein
MEKIENEKIEKKRYIENIERKKEIFLKLGKKKKKTRKK